MLTKREKDVVELVREGLSNSIIGEILDIRKKTVENHITNIYKKFKIKGRYEIWKSLI